jgi:iron complex transport system substrate-binding protein
MSAHRSIHVLCSAAALVLFSRVASPQNGPHRIISLAPSVTEVLFEAGLGSLVAGVTSYCRYPDPALTLPKVGGYLTPSYEALAALAPDLVVVLPEHTDVEPRLAALKMPVIRVDHRNFDGIIQSIVTLGERAGSGRQAAQAADALRQHLARVRMMGRGRARPRVLILFGRTDDFRRLYAAAPGTVHDDLLAHAGGENVLTSRAVPYPTLSAEGLMRLDPDVIVEFAPGSSDAGMLRQQWNVLHSLRAVKTGRVYVFTHDFLSVPGPRFVRFAETLAHTFYPR